MKRILGAILKTGRVLLAVAAGLLLVYNLYMLAARAFFGEEMPMFFGVASAAVVSGSMEPEINVGDVVIIRAQDSYGVGDVISFSNGDGTYTTHRVRSVREGGYETRGDANNVSEEVDKSAVVGKVVLVIPGLGAAAAFLQTPAGMFAVCGGAVAVWFLAGLISPRKEKRRKDGTQRDAETEN